MKFFVLAFALSMSPLVVQSAETVIIQITTAQQDAETMARTGVLRHCRTSGGSLEGIGRGPTRESAIKNCCFWGRPYREIGAAKSRSGVWFAVVRYR